MKRLVIIDGNSLLFRAYFAMREMVTKDGIYTQGVYAFNNMLTKIIGDYSPDYMAVAFDMKAPTFRHEKYPEYKAGRLATPIELLSQIPLAHELLDAMNIKVFEKETFEADDLIGTVTMKASEEGIESYIITGDKDELQLVSPDTEVIINKKGMTEFDVYDVAKMEERYGITPHQFIDLKGLMGDKSDNIPGVPGVGEKKGIALIKEYGSVEGVVEHADQIKGKLGENIRDNIGMALLSKELATIKRDVPIEFTFDELKFTEPDYDKLVALYKKLEFNSFLKKLTANAGKAGNDLGGLKATEATRDNIADIKTVDLQIFLDTLGADKTVAIRVDTDANHIDMPHTTSVALYSPAHNTFTYRELTPLDTEIILRNIADSGIKLIGKDLKSILYTLMCYGIDLPECHHDIEIAEYLLDPNKSKYSFSSMALKYTETVIQDDEALPSIDSAKRTLYLTARISDVQDRYMADSGVDKLFRDIEMPLVEVLASMEYNGIAVDRNVLIEQGIELDKKIESLESEIYEEAGIAFNINSPKQLGNILFEMLMIPYPKAKGKSYSTAQDVLDKLKDSYPIVKNVLEYRKATKLKSTYIDGLIALIGADGKIHPHFNQTVAATGRLSCTEPNLQNIPIRDEYGRNIRKAFIVSEPDNEFVGADYSQIELRILAALSDDDVLIDAFNTGKDIHTLTASRVFNIPMDEVTALDRSRAKAVNFGVIYGMSGFGLSEELGITRKDAQNYIDEYFDKHAKVKAFLDNQISQGKADKEVHTMFGRVRQIPEFASRRFNDIQLANRLAMNTPIQGTAADIIKIAMVKVYNAIKNNNLASKLILQIHDELIVEARAEELHQVEELLTYNMENAVDFKVKLVSDMNVGKTWYDLK